MQPASRREVPLNGTEGIIRDLVKTQGHHALKSVQEVCSLAFQHSEYNVLCSSHTLEYLKKCFRFSEIRCYKTRRR